MTALKTPIWTVAEYLLMERTSTVKHEFLGGHVYATAGGRPIHNQIVANLVSALVSALRESHCVAYSSDQRVRNTAGDIFFYPDASVSCEPQFDAVGPTSLTNPCLVCEVLSPTTAEYDRGVKFDRYRTFDSLRAVLFVSSDAADVELHERQNSPSAPWTKTQTQGVTLTLKLKDLNCSLSLADIYAKTSLPLKIRVADSSGPHVASE